MSRFVGDEAPSRDSRRRSLDRSRPPRRPCRRSDFPVARALHGENAAELEALYLAPEGRAVWTHVAAEPLRDDAGAVTGAICVVRRH